MIEFSFHSLPALLLGGVSASADDALGPHRTIKNFI